MIGQALLVIQMLYEALPLRQGRKIKTKPDRFGQVLFVVEVTRLARQKCFVGTNADSSNVHRKFDVGKPTVLFKSCIKE